MRASTVIRLALFTLAIMVGLAILFNLLLASAVERSRRAPVIAATTVEDRLYVAHASAMQRRPGGDASYDLTAIPSEQAFAALRAAAEGDSSAENEEGEQQDDDLRTAWLEPETFPGDLRGMLEADGRLLKAFDGSLLLVPPGRKADELVPKDPRMRERIRTHLATRNMPREEFAQLLGTSLSDVDLLSRTNEEKAASPEDEAKERGETAEPGELDPDGAAPTPQTAPIRRSAGGEVPRVLLTYAGRERVVRLELTRADQPATPLGPPAYFEYDRESGELSVSAVEPEPPGDEAAEHADGKAPTQSRAGGHGAGEEGAMPARAATAEEIEEQAVEGDEAAEDGPSVRIYAADSLQRYEQSAPEERSDLLVWLATPRSEENGEAGGGGLFGSPARQWTPRLVWLPLRDGEWQQPIEIGTRVHYFRSVFEPGTSFVHLVYHYETGEGEQQWRYQRLDLEQTRIRAPASRLAWPGEAMRETDPFDIAWVEGRLHLFVLNRVGGGITHAATQPLGERDSIPREVTVAHTAGVPKFGLRPTDDLDMGWWIIGSTMLGMLLVLLVMFLHVRNQQAEAATPDITRFGSPSDEGASEERAKQQAERSHERDKETRKEPDPSQQGPPLDPFDVGAILERFGYHPAGPFVRFFALVADLLILIVPLYLLAGAAGMNIEDLGWPSEPDFWPLYLLFWALQFAYFFPLEYYWGTTPGKKLFGLRLRNPERAAKPLDWSALLWRNLVRGIDYPLFFIMFTSDRWQRIGDRLGKTVVVRDTDEEASEE